MVKYSHRCGGSSHTICTNSPIYDYSTGNGGRAPEYGKHGSTDSIQHKLQAPMGERKGVYNDKTSPKAAEGPGGHYPRGSGKSDSMGVTAKRNGPGLDRGVPRSAGNQNDFAQTFSRIGAGVTSRGMKKSGRDGF
jgi:hypothetical protein